MHVPVPSVGIHARIHDHNSPLQKVGMRRGQRLDGGHGCFCADSFVAVNVVAQVHPNHAIPAVHAFVHASRILGLQFIQSDHVFRRGHDQSQQGSSFRRLAVGGQLPVRNRFRHVLHIVDHEVVPGEGFAELMADERLRRGLGR